MNRIFLLLIIFITTSLAGCSSCVTTPAARNMVKVRYENNLYEVPAKPSRVVLLSSALTELWINAGGEDSIAACPLSGGLSLDLRSKLRKDIIDIGSSTTLSLEKVLAAEPDLVIGLSNYALNDRMKTAIENSGIPFLPVKNVYLQDNCNILKLFGEILDKQKLASAKIKSLEQRLDNEKTRRNGKKAKKVLMIWGTPNSIMLVTPNSRHGELLRLAGGQNIVPPANKDHGYIPISLEYIMEQQPDMIIFNNHGDTQKIEVKLQQELMSNPAWNGLKAVRERQVHLLPEEIFPINPGLRSIDAIVYLGHLLYP